MKKLLLTLLVLAMCITGVSLVGAEPQSECNGLTGVAFGLCNAYYSQHCDTEPIRMSCQSILRNVINETGNVPWTPCPCFDASDIQGQGIDFEAQVLNEATCFDDIWPDGIELFGQRTVDIYIDWVANATVAIEGLTARSQCLLFDYEYGIDNFAQDISDEEVASCIAIMLNSQMFQLNNCPSEGT